MSFWKKLGKGLKFAAPVAAMAIPGLGPVASMALSAGLGTAGAKMSGDSWKRSLLTGGIDAAGTGVGKLPIAGKLGTLKKIAGPLVGSQGGGGGSETTGGAGWGDLVPAAATAINAYGKSAAENRGAELAATMDQNQQAITADDAFQRQLIARAAEDRAGQNNAWRGLMSSSYAQNYVPPAPSANDPYRRAMPGVSDDVRAGATALAGQTRDDLMSGRFRTNGGAPLPMPVRTPLPIRPGLMQPGTGERIANVVGPGLSMWDALNERRRTQGRPPVMTTQPVQA